MQIKVMNIEDMDSVIPLYIDYYNNYKDSCWTETTVKKRIKQVLTIEDSYSLIMKDDNGIVCGFVMGYFKQCICEDSDVLQGCIWRISLDEVSQIEILHDSDYRYGSFNYVRKNGKRFDWIKDFYDKLN